MVHFLKGKVSARTGRPFQITRSAMQVLCAHDWPGNVRELENAIERAAALCEGDIIQTADLPAAPRAAAKPPASPLESEVEPLPAVPDAAFYPLHPISPPTATTGHESVSARPIQQLKTFLHDQELAHINRALELTGGDKEQAAILLGVSLATLYRKLNGEDKDLRTRLAALRRGAKICFSFCAAISIMRAVEPISARTLKIEKLCH